MNIVAFSVSLSPERWEREDTWQSLAIASAVILLVGFVAASMWVIIATDDNTRLLRVQISAPFGVFGGAVVTFCTIVWRGLISKRQADSQLKATNLQREQIDRLALQIAATDESNLADLLQRGAQLIAETGKKAHMAAGVAILQSVAEAPNAKFAVQAMNLLADYVQDNYEYGGTNSLVDGAISALASGASLDRYSARTITFDAKLSGAIPINSAWEIITGVKAVRYSGGFLEYADEFEWSPKTRYFFTETKLESSVVDLKNISFNRCAFDSCEIARTTVSAVKRNSFDRCDFSNAVIDNPSGFPDLRREGNYYNVGQEPKASRRTPNWSKVLIAQDLGFEDLGDLDEAVGR